MLTSQNQQHFVINYLFQALVFLEKIGILSIVSESKNSKLNIFRLFSFNISHENIPELTVYLTTY